MATPTTLTKNLTQEAWGSGDNVIAVRSLAGADYSNLPASELSDTITFNTGTLSYKSLSDGTLAVIGRGGSIMDKVEIPSTHGGKAVTEIDNSAFMYDDLITEIIIPVSIRRIGSQAFMNSKLTKVTFEDTTMHVVYFKNPGWTGKPQARYTYGSDIIEYEDTEMQLVDVEESIYGCLVPRNTASIYFYSEDKSTQTLDYTSADGLIGNCLFTVYAKKIGSATYYALEAEAYYTCTNNKDLQNYNGLEIDTGAFQSCEGLTSVTLPRRTTRLGNSAFMSCENLKTVSFTQDHRISVIGSNAFEACTALEVVTMYDGVKEIGSRAFYDCRKLSDCILGDGLQIIGTNAFAQCAKLEYVTIPASVKRIEKSAFEGLPTNNELREPERWIIFEAPSTWVMTEDEVVAPDGSGVTVWNPRELYGTDSTYSNVSENGDRLSAVWYAYNWIKLEKMLTPQVSLSGQTLSMTDPLGIAEGFNIYLRQPDGAYKLKCTVRAD